MKTYQNFLKHILENGTEKPDRTGTGTLSTFGYQMRFDLNEGFPLLTTKKIHFKSVVHELLWFIAGDTNIRYLVQNGVRIWNDWPYETYKKSDHYQGESMKAFAEKIKNDAAFARKWGDLGPVYGAQWRRFEGRERTVDQLQELLSAMEADPHSRRLILNSWNPPLIEKMALPPCHMMVQFYINDGVLSSQLYQRSADAFLGVPFNIASYALLTLMIAHVMDLKPGVFIHTVGDAHIYSNHLEQVKTQLQRSPRALPTIELDPAVRSLFDFKPEHITLKDYNPHPRLKAKVAV